MTEAARPKQKIAILGGGIGAITAAFALTDQDGWQDHCDITLYQLGWRLGGKCASGHNREYGERIEEHGLHIWLGFYENSFRLIQKCYQELGRSPTEPLSRWEEAFEKHSRVTLMEQKDGRWLPWVLDFPTNEAVPGKSVRLLKPWDYVRMLLGWLVQHHDRTVPAQEPVTCRHVRVEWVQNLLTEVVWGGQVLKESAAAARVVVEDTVAGAVADVKQVVQETVTSVETQVADVAGEIVADIKKVVTRTVTSVEAVVPVEKESDTAVGDTHLHHAQQLAQALSEDPHQHQARHYRGLLWLLEEFCQHFHQAFAREIEHRDDLRRLWVLIRLGVAVISGMLLDGVLFDGFDVIDRWDFTEWLRRHGATDREVWWSAPVRGIYELVFGYEGGDTGRPNLAAGTALRGSLRMFFAYKGAIFWKMQGGMADTIFTPYYQTLQRRGVKFAFFHRVHNLGLSADKQSIQTIDLRVQATVKEEIVRRHGGYQPLRKVKGLDGWPSAPFHDQLVEGEQLLAQGIDLESAWSGWPDVGQRLLERGRDFDLVVLGISLGSVPFICKELIEANPHWRALVEHVPTVPTQAFQLWFNRTAEELGRPPGEQALVSSYVEPMDTMADMSQLIDREDWPVEQPVKNIAYLCGPLKDMTPLPPFTDTRFAAAQLEKVKQEAVRFLQTSFFSLWPGAADPQNPGAFHWDLLVDPHGRPGVARFESQYARANVEPSERYVLSVKGSTRYRLPAGQSGFGNLFLAGDWTLNGINAGSVEAATISGLQAARAIGGRPEHIFGETDL